MVELNSTSSSTTSPAQRKIKLCATTPTLYSMQSFLQGSHKPCFQTYVRGLVLKAFFFQEPCLKDYYFLSFQFREHIMTRRRVSESTS